MNAAMYGAPGVTNNDVQAAMYSGPGDQMAGGGDVEEKAEPAKEDAPLAPAVAPPTHSPQEAPGMKPGPRSAVGKILNSVFSPQQESSPLGVKDSAGALLRAMGGETSVGSKLKQGGHVPGKPKVPGPVDSYANDTVSAKLSPGEIVLPRSVTQSKDPVSESAKFVAAVIAKKRGKM